MGKWGLSEQVGAWWFSGGTGAMVWQHPGMPFMEDQGDSASPLRNEEVRLVGMKKSNEKIKYSK